MTPKVQNLGLIWAVFLGLLCQISQASHQDNLYESDLERSARSNIYSRYFWPDDASWWWNSYKRAPGSEFLGKRAPGSEFLGKRAPGSEFLGKRAPGSEFLGKRAPGSEFLGKRAPGSEFLGKRAPGSEFLGKRSISPEEEELFEVEEKRAAEIPLPSLQSTSRFHYENEA